MTMSLVIEIREVRGWTPPIIGQRGCSRNSTRLDQNASRRVLH